MKNNTIFAGEKVVVFNYPRELMSEWFRNKTDVGVAYHPRTKQWGYIANVGWGHMVWFPETTRSFVEQQNGKTFQIDFSVVNMLNKEANYSTTIKYVFG